MVNQIAFDRTLFLVTGNSYIQQSENRIVFIRDDCGIRAAEPRFRHQEQHPYAQVSDKQIRLTHGAEMLLANRFYVLETCLLVIGIALVSGREFGWRPVTSGRD